MANAGLRAYREVLRLVRRLPADARTYYAKYARENFVNYRHLSADDDLSALLRRAHDHSAWVLSKYSIDAGEAARLRKSALNVQPSEGKIVVAAHGAVVPDRSWQNSGSGGLTGSGT